MIVFKSNVAVDPLLVSFVVMDKTGFGTVVCGSESLVTKEVFADVVRKIEEAKEAALKRQFAVQLLCAFGYKSEDGIPRTECQKWAERL
jgi:hypothetical protein